MHGSIAACGAVRSSPRAHDEQARARDARAEAARELRGVHAAVEVRPRCRRRTLTHESTKPSSASALGRALAAGELGARARPAAARAYRSSSPRKLSVMSCSCSCEPVGKHAAASNARAIGLVARGGRRAPPAGALPRRRAARRRRTGMRERARALALGLARRRPRKRSAERGRPARDLRLRRR